MPAKILVTSQGGGSRVELIGRSGKQLMTSEVFREPRAKAAIVRALKALIGNQVTVEDNTLPVKATAVSKRRLNGKAPSTSKSTSTKKSAATVKAPSTGKASSTTKARSTSKSSATKRARVIKTSSASKRGTGSTGIARTPKTVTTKAAGATGQTRRGRPRKAG